ncbi:MAG: NAD(P)-dependent oxidoreductase [Gammaproteobacteria bacterium]|nr:NAD(P)-dependent oxidoreductase [Gammaproteobacteria bacterium]
MKRLLDRTILITGASRGIGRAIALAAAREGANIVIAAKTAEPHAKLPGTIHTVAAEVRALGVRALPLQVDVREEVQVADLMTAVEKEFGRLDALINNAGAIQLTNVANTPVKRYDLMQQVNSRAVFICAKAALPLLRAAGGGHIISLSPPLNLRAKWLAPHAPYTLSKFGMTLLSLGLAGEFAADKISVTTLWPRTTIATAAIEFAVGAQLLPLCRTPEIMADATLEVLATTDLSLTGQTLLDEDFLRTRGWTDFCCYAHNPAYADQLFPDLFIDS